MDKERTAAMNRLYVVLKEKARGCRDREVRIKLELFLLALRIQNVQEACARRGFSRSFYYKWWNRFRKSGHQLESLLEHSRRPHHSPRRIQSEIEKRIRYYQLRDYGARMIYGFLKQEGIQVSQSTISHVLRKRQRTKLRRRERLKTHRKRYELPIPGQRLQIDVKYVPQLIAGLKTYTYVAIDECTRWRFARAYHQLDAGTTVLFLEELKKHCPFVIHALQTDNGQEFTYKLNPVAQHLQHPMALWCQKNQMVHRLIPPGVKELNGKVERSHRIDEHYFYWSAPTHSLDLFNQSLRRWITFYNEKRPHGGLNFITPWQKLQERLETLKLPSSSPEDVLLAQMRLTFLKETPMRLSQLDRQLLQLEQTLNTLLKAA